VDILLYSLNSTSVGYVVRQDNGDGTGKLNGWQLIINCNFINGLVYLCSSQMSYLVTCDVISCVISFHCVDLFSLVNVMLFISLLFFPERNLFCVPHVLT